MHPILIDLGFFQVPTYGLLLALGVILGLWRARIRATAGGLDADRVVDLGLWLIIWALLGSKLLLIIVEFPRYLHHPAELIGVLRAGGVFLGGFLAAVIAALLLLKRYKLPLLPTFDALSPSISLGQAIGRIGCLAAGCCWGAHCDLPWAITYHDIHAANAVGTPLGIPLHPFPIYASLSNFLLYGILAALYRSRLKPGRVFASYLLLYGITRFLLEYTRGDAIRGFVFGGALSTSQLITSLMILSGIILHIWIGRRQLK